MRRSSVARVIELHTHLKYEKQIRNLQAQEARLHRRYEKESAELCDLQEAREEARLDQLDQAAKASPPAQCENRAFEPAEVGFEFSSAQIMQYIGGPSAAVQSPKVAGPAVQRGVAGLGSDAQAA